MRRLAAADLLLLPVKLRGIQLGRPVDLLLDPAAGRAVGLEILARDEQHRFLPLAGAEVHRDAIVLRSTLVLLDEQELVFYRTRGHTIRALRGAKVTQAGEPVGVLRDVAIGLGGAVTELLVETDGSERWVAAQGLSVVAPVPAR